jgi:hypothetical protein
MFLNVSRRDLWVEIVVAYFKVLTNYLSQVGKPFMIFGNAAEIGVQVCGHHSYRSLRFQCW